MTITREELEERIRLLQKEEQSALANANALSGAIQDCRFWLDRLAASEESDDGAEGDEPSALRAVS